MGSETGAVLSRVTEAVVDGWKWAIRRAGEPSHAGAAVGALIAGATLLLVAFKGMLVGGALAVALGAALNSLFGERAER